MKFMEIAKMAKMAKKRAHIGLLYTHTHNTLE